MAKKWALKSKRNWLEGREHSNSYYELSVDKSDGEVNLTLADCNRRICWYLGKPGDKRGKAKIAVLKNLIDSIYNHLHEVEEKK